MRIAEHALANGHQVTAVVRRPAEFALQHPALRVVQANFDDQNSVTAAIHGQDAVLSAIGAPQSRAATSIHADSAHSILAALRATGVRRWICVTSGGTNPQHDPNLPVVFEQVFKRIYANIYADQIVMEQVVLHSDVDWTIVRPAALTDEPATGRCRTAETFAIQGGNRTPRADLAAFMIEQIEQPASVRKAIALAV
jgi:putative NADH-flavin reductase